MDLFDFIPIVPPGMPGESRERSPGHQLASGVGSALLPAINFIVVLVAGFAHSATVAFVVLPAVSGALLYVLARRVSVGAAWSIALAMFCAVFCFIANGVAFFFVALGDFWHTF
jgi:presenilin-like A22 family membrane protease